MINDEANKIIQLRVSSIIQCLFDRKGKLKLSENGLYYNNYYINIRVKLRSE